MFGRLLAGESRFFDQFNAHAAHIVLAVHALKAIIDGDGDRYQHARVVDDEEHAADRVTADTIKLLQKTRFTPFERDDILHLINKMDDVCDLIQDAAEAITLYEPAALTPEARRLAVISCGCCERVKDIVAQLGSEEGELEGILKTCEEIDRLESDADRVVRSAISRLFREEQDTRELIKLKAIYELLETITDRCLDVANVAEAMTLSQR